ncbi:hypothetical protein [Staphylococcus delphini]|uniref:Uncharacterized protein n=1 Tax=Staphylococcus delphini TaxID=53344 RepID=A0AAQ0D4Z5_9STAP|nr:hypothetical protein [Staphylococcus delphini]QUM66033.1 hypothetical protein IPU21_07740 [Staphylococcus delphini]QUM68467.1 hypothetical protein IPU22_07690 [Staphylococcus delphini]
MLTASLCEVEALVEVDVLIDVDALNDACVDATADLNSDDVPLFDAFVFNESTVDTNVLAPSFVVLPFDAS